MPVVHYDSLLSDEQRRLKLYDGDLFVYSPVAESLELVQFARTLLADAFGGRDPEYAQFEMPVEEFAHLLGELKPRFIHHPECKRLLPAMLARLGCDPQATYFDVPRMRSATSNDYLSTGIAYAFHPHRDTWYSAPFCQINWWLPVFPLTRDNCMAFHPRYFSHGVRNSSNIYNYQEWNRSSRFNAAQHVGVDTRQQPKALDPVELEPDVRLLPPPGGVILFSAAQLHSTVPNTSGRTRYSIDFRVVNLEDVEAQSGARNVDSRCTGSTMGDYLRCSDLEHLPPAAIAPYDSGPPQQVAV
ncbi:MAG: hypothetical protein ACRESY_10015 [Steroidobacteraceae bacterium]